MVRLVSYGAILFVCILTACTTRDDQDWKKNPNTLDRLYDSVGLEFTYKGKVYELIKVDSAPSYSEPHLWVVLRSRDGSADELVDIRTLEARRELLDCIDRK